jgi:hypothetical protein
METPTMSKSSYAKVDQISKRDVQSTIRKLKMWLGTLERYHTKTYGPLPKK